MTQTTYFRQGELDLIQHLPKDTPYGIQHVSKTQLSIARYFGSIKYNGQNYTYFSPSDELIRDDVLKLVVKIRRAKKKKATREVSD